MYGAVALGKVAHICSPELQHKGGVLRVVFLVLNGPVLVLLAADLTVAQSLALKIVSAFILSIFLLQW